MDFNDHSLCSMISNHFSEILGIDKTAEDKNMTHREICEVFSNNKGYYKEILDYYVFAKNKIRAFRHTKIPTIKSQR